MGGTLQKGEGTDNEFSDGRKSLHPDNSKRRTVYLPLRRSNLATLLTLFDFGDATTSTEIRAANERGATGAVHDEQQVRRGAFARAGAKLLKRTTRMQRRISRAWYNVLGREPTPEEIRRQV